MPARYRIRSQCALCRNNDLEDVLDLPSTPLANEFIKPEQAHEVQDVFPLDLVLCRRCGHLQCKTLVDPERLFRDYVYSTSTSPVTLAHLERQAQFVVERFDLLHRSRPLVIEIGSNDGALLGILKRKGIENILGIDPANAMTDIARKNGIPTLTNFFSSRLASDILQSFGVADVIIANNVLAHAEDILDIALGAKRLLGENGALVMEVSYLYDMVESPVFDTIYHEHFSYHAVKPLASMFETIGMEIVRAERIPEQKGRGSLRICASPAHGRAVRDDTPTAALIAAEEAAGLFAAPFYRQLRNTISETGKALRTLLEIPRSRGKNIIGYGAAAKLTTLMYALGLDERHVQVIIDDSPIKQGLLTPGLHLPVKSSRALYDDHPDICVVFAWNFADAIIAKHPLYRGKFVVPLPAITITPPGELS